MKVLGVCLAFVFATAGFAADAPSNWHDVLAARLPLYGHRNWIVVADSAYPEQTNPGIETIDSGEDGERVLSYVLRTLSHQPHVTPVVFTDEELNLLPESDAPGITNFRGTLKSLLGELPVNTLPHEQLLARLGQVSQSFNVLIIKTKSTLPYTSVFLQLNCAYWPPEAEARLRQAISVSKRK